MLSYRNGIRATLWIGALFGGLTLLGLTLWGILALAGDESGAVVARVLALVCGVAAAIDLIALLVLLARLQLTLLAAEDLEQNGG